MNSLLVLCLFASLWVNAYGCQKRHNSLIELVSLKARDGGSSFLGYGAVHLEKARYVDANLPYLQKDGIWYKWAVWLSGKALREKNEQEKIDIAEHTIDLFKHIKENNRLPENISPYADINARVGDIDGTTIYCLLSGYIRRKVDNGEVLTLDEVEKILEKNADVNLVDESGTPFLHVIFFYTKPNQTSLIKKFLQSRGSVAHVLNYLKGRDAALKISFLSRFMLGHSGDLKSLMNAWQEVECEERPKIKSLLQNSGLPEVLGTIIAEYYTPFSDEECRALEQMRGLMYFYGPR